MSELFSIQLQNRQQQGRDGVWLDLPTTTEQVQAALRQIGISSDNPQGLFISGYFAEEEKRFAIPYNMVLASNVDELNFLASRLETLSTGERAELNAALQAPQSELFSIGRITDFPENVDYYVHLPDVHGPAQLGDYYLNRSGMVDMPEEWKGGIDTAQFGRYVAQQEQGAFTQYGYLVKSGDEWQKVHEGQPVRIKLEAYNFTDYGIIPGVVESISRDAIDLSQPGQQMAKDPNGRPIQQGLVYATRHAAQLVALPELRSSSETDPDFWFDVFLSRETQTSQHWRNQRIDAEALEQFLNTMPRPVEIVYVCGSNGFAETATAGLVAAGIEPNIIKTERFGGAVA